MLNSFKNILIPVDLSLNTELAVKRAIELTDYGATIHLIYVLNHLSPRITSLAKRYLTQPGKIMDHVIVDTKLTNGNPPLKKAALIYLFVNGFVSKAAFKKQLKEKPGNFLLTLS